MFGLKFFVNTLRAEYALLEFAEHVKGKQMCKKWVCLGIIDLLNCSESEKGWVHASFENSSLFIYAFEVIVPDQRLVFLIAAKYQYQNISKMSISH